MFHMQIKILEGENFLQFKFDTESNLTKINFFSVRFVSIRNFPILICFVTKTSYK